MSKEFGLEKRTPRMNIFLPFLLDTIGKGYSANKLFKKLELACHRFY